MLKEVFVKFVEEARKGHDVVLDMRFGQLHAYPNGDLQFENSQTTS